MCAMANFKRQTEIDFVKTMMRNMLPMAVVLWVALVEVGAEEKIELRKCCRINEILNGDATSCVPAPWPHYSLVISSTARIGNSLFNLSETQDTLKAPLNESWLRRWVPPGVPLKTIVEVTTAHLRFRPFFAVQALRVPVRTSGLTAEATDGDWRLDRVLFLSRHVDRRGPDGSVRRGFYCVDAALPPFSAPFALLMETRCLSKESDCVQTCCDSGGVLKEAANGSWSCALNFSLSLASVTALRQTFDPEYPIFSGIEGMPLCLEGRRSTPRLSTHPSARALVHPYTDGFFSTTLSCASYIVRASGAAEHVAVHCEVQRWSRAFYWCTRPLSFVSVLLLLAALVFIVTSPRLRRSVHGWALGCHAGCLLAFNLLQVAFYLSVSDKEDSVYFRYRGKGSACTIFALSIYFLLTAASCWLTVICLNMSTGFRATRTARIGGRKRRFLLLSAFAWATPTLLTAACAYAYLTKISMRAYEIPPWYFPSLMETRTCFKEVFIPSSYKTETVVRSRKWGSALYYYTPMTVLSAVNVICVIRTVLRVRFLTRGNSVLHRDTRERYKKDQREEETTTPQHCNGQETRRGSAAPFGPKSVSVYIRLLLCAGVLELTAETAAWASSMYVGYARMSHWTQDTVFSDQSLSYRAVGYLTDLARAAIVLWLAAPDAAGVQTFSRSLRRSCTGTTF